MEPVLKLSGIMDEILSDKETTSKNIREEIVNKIREDTGKRTTRWNVFLMQYTQQNNCQGLTAQECVKKASEEYRKIYKN